MVAEIVAHAARMTRRTSASSIPPCLQKRRARADRTMRGCAMDTLFANAHLGAHELEDLVPRARERRVGDQVLPDAALPRDVDRDGGLEAPGAPGEDEAPVAEEGRLVHVVGDEEDRLPRRDGDAVQLFLQRDPRDRK